MQRKLLVGLPAMVGFVDSVLASIIVVVANDFDLLLSRVDVCSTS